MRTIDKAVKERVFTPRKSQSHKGDYGTVGFISGSIGMAGACVLNVQAAMRVGAGLGLADVKHAITQVLAAHPHHVGAALAGIKQQVQGQPGTAARLVLGIEGFDLLLRPRPIAGRAGAQLADAKARIIRPHPDFQRMTHQILDVLQPIVRHGCRPFGAGLKPRFSRAFNTPFNSASDMADRLALPVTWR